MKALTTRWVASCIAAVSIALIISAMVLSYLNRHRVPADLSGWDFSGVLGQVTYLAVPVVGFVLASRRPGNRIGWLFLAAGLALGLNSFSAEYGLRALVVAPGSLPAGRAAVWLANWIWVVPFAMFALVLYRLAALVESLWITVPLGVAALVDGLLRRAVKSKQFEHHHPEVFGACGLLILFATLGTTLIVVIPLTLHPYLVTSIPLVLMALAAVALANFHGRG